MANSQGIDPATGKHIPHNIIHGTNMQLIVFLCLNMWPSHLGLPLLLAIIILSKRVDRHATFINLCIAFIIIGIASTLLLYANALSGPEPPPILCLFQASLLYGMPPLASMAAFMLVLQMFFKIRAAHYGKPYEDEDHLLRVWIMLVMPYIIYFIPVIATAIIGANDPIRVSRNRRFFYCSVECLPLTNAITVGSAIILFATIVMEAWTIILLVRHRTVARMNGSRLRRSMDLNFPLRILGFGLYVITAMSLSLLSVTSPSSPVPDLVIASAATVIILIFGTQLDILRVMCFWNTSPPVMVVEQDYKEVDLKYAFDADSTFAKPWKTPGRMSLTK